MTNRDSYGFGDKCYVSYVELHIVCLVAFSKVLQAKAFENAIQSGNPKPKV